jgi:proteic killer suppression protein
MIRSFKHAALKRYWNTGGSKGLPPKDLAKIGRILTALNVATVPQDMDLPRYRFHQLKGNRKRTYAAWVRGNWNITFEWENDGPVRVNLEDYHGD